MSGWLVSCVLIVAVPSSNSAQAYEQTTGCRIQYEPGKELTPVRNPRVQSVFRRLLARAGITEDVLLCADIPLDRKNFAETIRRADRQAVVTVSNLLLEFTDAEISGVLAHELAHLMAGDPDRPRPERLDEYLQEERKADIRATELVGRAAIRAAVTRVYRTSVSLGFESKAGTLRRYRDARLEWILNGPR